MFLIATSLITLLVQRPPAHIHTHSHTQLDDPEKVSKVTKKPLSAGVIVCSVDVAVAEQTSA